MKQALKLLFVMTLGAFLLTACGDDNPINGVGTVCASDDASVGDTATCPDSTEVIDFCINGGNGSCWYVVGGEQVSCGNCFDGGSIQTCVQEAFALCPQ
jgi:predicted small secreted protein